jgi:hypothetical protein
VKRRIEGVIREVAHGRIGGWSANLSQEARKARHPLPDAVLARFAARQHGLITSAQLAAAGLDYPAALKKVKQGHCTATTESSTRLVIRTSHQKAVGWRRS